MTLGAGGAPALGSAVEHVGGGMPDGGTRGRSDAGADSRDSGMSLVCGEVLLDVLFDPSQTSGDLPARFAGHPGGSPANTAVAVARLGSSSGLCARISCSSIGALLRRHLEVNGVDLSYSVDAQEPASLAFVDVSADGVASYAFYVDGTADWQWTVDELPAELPADVTALHAGSIAAARLPGRAAIATWFGGHRGRRLLSFDPNVRPDLVGSPSDARSWTEHMVGQVDLVKASIEDIHWLYPGRSADDVAATWRTLGARIVVVTLGPDGAVGYSETERVRAAARPVAVVDTVGAGDSYSGGLLHFLESEQLMSAAATGRLPHGALAAALDVADAVAVLTCSRAGADPPHADEVARLLERSTAI